MAGLKFKKTLDLPSSPTFADDGVYFVLDNYSKELTKIAVISNGIIKEFSPEVGTNLTAGEGLEIDNGTDEIYLLAANETDLGGVKIWKGTKAAYDALGTYDDETIYYVEDINTYDKSVHLVDESLSLSVTGNHQLSITTPISLSIWNRVYDVTISWKDGADSLRKLSDFIHHFDIFYGFKRHSSGDLIVSINVSGSPAVAIPNGARVVLHLLDETPA